MLSVTDVVRKVRDEGGHWKFTPENIPCDVGAFQFVVELAVEARTKRYLIEVKPHPSTRPGQGAAEFDAVVASGVTEEGEQHLAEMGFPRIDAV